MSLDNLVHTSRSEALEYLNRWGFVPDGEPFATHSSLLWPVARRSNDQEAMLKIPDPHSDEAHGADLLSLWDGQGAVKLLEREGHVQLLERLIAPSKAQSLKDMVVDGKIAQATHILCDVIDQLHDRPSGFGVPSFLIPVMEQADSMAYFLKEGRPKGEAPELFSDALSLSRQLYQGVDRELLHGDIHHFNVMQNAHGDWFSLDPKGLLGPKAYEYSNIFCNPCKHTDIVANEANMAVVRDVVCERSGLQTDVVMAHAFARAAQVAAWCLDDSDRPYWLLCAKTARKFL